MVKDALPERAFGQLEPAENFPIGKLDGDVI
jgi:hypothetical protein